MEMSKVMIAKVREEHHYTLVRNAFQFMMKRKINNYLKIPNLLRKDVNKGV
jgi:hypothetical protein